MLIGQDKMCWVTLREILWKDLAESNIRDDKQADEKKFKTRKVNVVFSVIIAVEMISDKWHRERRGKEWEGKWNIDDIARVVLQYL